MPTIDDILLETTHAMDAIQLAMSYSASLHEKYAATQEEKITEAAQSGPKLPPQPASLPMLPVGRIIDTYA